MTIKDFINDKNKLNLNNLRILESSKDKTKDVFEQNLLNKKRNRNGDDDTSNYKFIQKIFKN